MKPNYFDSPELAAALVSSRTLSTGIAPAPRAGGGE
jgi:hypothetical protein